MTSLVGIGLWLAAAGHFCILGASFQVPARLRWKEDLARLTSFNRKLMWTYGAFTVLTIVSFGLLTIALHDELLRGDRAALALAAFIATYWLARVGVDLFYFDHRDWPAGTRFVVGHLLLTGLFLALALTYVTVIAWHLLLRR
jgi:alginate O-acetyltransferase complex protein AlgI